MVGTPAGGRKVVETIKRKYGEDYYRNIGSMGGKTPTRTPKGFAANPELARKAGKIGGARSHRNRNKAQDNA